MRDPYKTPKIYHVKKVFAVAAAIFTLAWLIGWGIFFCANDAFGQEGSIIVYDSEGNVEKEFKFKYDPQDDPYAFPYTRGVKSKALTPERKEIVDDQPVAPPKGLHFVPQQEVEEDDDQGKRDQVRKRIIGYKSETVGNKQVTKIIRKERSATGKKYISKEVIIDNRFTGLNPRQRYQVNKRVEPSQIYYKRKRVP